MPQNTNAFVREFHETFRAAVANEPSIATGFEKLRADLIVEEASETLLAVMKADEVEFVDGLGDLDYVIEGAAITFGIDLADGFDHSMKIHEKYKYYELLGLLVLGVRSFYELLVDPDGQSTPYPYDSDAGRELDLKYTIAMLTNLKAIVWSIAKLGDIPLAEVIRAIHESNMSKLDASGLPIFREDGKILKGPAYFTPTAKIKEILGVE